MATPRPNSSVRLTAADSHDAVGCRGGARLVPSEPPLGGADQRATHALTVVHLADPTGSSASAAGGGGT